MVVEVSRDAAVLVFRGSSSAGALTVDIGKAILGRQSAAVDAAGTDDRRAGFAQCCRNATPGPRGRAGDDCHLPTQRISIRRPVHRESDHWQSGRYGSL